MAGLGGRRARSALGALQGGSSGRPPTRCLREREAARSARLLVHQGGVEGRILAIASRSAPGAKACGRSWRSRSWDRRRPARSRADILHRARMVAFAAPGDQLVEELRPEKHALDVRCPRRASRRGEGPPSGDGPAPPRPAGCRCRRAEKPLDGSVIRCTPLISEPRMMVWAATPGELPATMWTQPRREGPDRAGRTEGRETSRQPSTTSLPPSPAPA